MKKRVAICAGALAFVSTAISPAFAAAPQSAAMPYLWQKCSHVHTKYRHGVGKRYAHDHTKSGTNPVTNFYRSTRLYNTAMRWNKRLDADKDGIACEAH